MSTAEFILSVYEMTPSPSTLKGASGEGFWVIPKPDIAITVEKCKRSSKLKETQILRVYHIKKREPSTMHRMAKSNHNVNKLYTCSTSKSKRVWGAIIVKNSLKTFSNNYIF